jgi:hypothetical protein
MKIVGRSLFTMWSLPTASRVQRGARCNTGGRPHEPDHRSRYCTKPPGRGRRLVWSTIRPRRGRWCDGAPCRSRPTPGITYELPGPGLIDRFRLITAQLRCEASDQHRVFSSVLWTVKSSARRDHEVSVGCTHTNDMLRSAASCPRTLHRCPVGSQDTVTPAKPLAPALTAAQSSATSRSQARHRNVLRASTFES